MNLILLHAPEIAADGSATLRDARARHVIAVLRAAPGRELRCGIVDGPIGSALVTAVAGDTVTLACRFEPSIEPRPEDTLLLAVPRPKILRRVVEDATALGFGRILLVRTWRVDRSHLESRWVDDGALWPHVRAGLEQARRTRPPKIHVEPLFKPFVEDRLDALVPPARFVADPDAATATLAARVPGPFALAIGPERGFTPYEVDALRAAGFSAVSAGPWPLRVPTAVALLAGQLTLLRAQQRAAQRSRGRSQP